MKWKPALVLVLAVALSSSNPAGIAAAESGKNSKTGQDTGSEKTMSGFDQLAVSPNPEGGGQTAGSGNSGGYGLTPPSGSGADVHAGMPHGNPGQGESAGSGLEQFSPEGPGPAPTPSPGQNAPGKSGKSASGKPGKGEAGIKPAPKQDLSQIINGTWRVQFSNGFVANMAWRFDPRRSTFFDGQKEIPVQVSGNMIRAEGTNAYTGAQQVLTIKFVSPREAVGALGVEGPPGKPGSALYLQLHALKAA